MDLEDLVYDDGIARRCYITTRSLGEGEHLEAPPNPFSSDDLEEDHCYKAVIEFTLSNRKKATWDSSLSSFVFEKPNESGLHTIALVSTLRQAYDLIGQPLGGDEWEAAQDIVSIDDKKEQKRVLNFLYDAWSQMFIPVKSGTELIAGILPVEDRHGNLTMRPPVALAFLPSEREVRPGHYRTYRNIKFFDTDSVGVQYEDDDVVTFSTS